jgi:hypothetical protein
MVVVYMAILSGCGDSKQDCVPECSDGETRCTDALNFQVCERPPDDPCAARWGEETPCPEEQFCVADTGQCQGCTPSCDGKVCGPDGCQGTCPPGCQWPEVCNTELGRCE